MPSIMGQSKVSVEQCENFIRKKNSNAPYLASIYKKYCDIYGIRLECAWVQMCLETNFLRYSNASITTLDMHNYAGLGAVDGNGRRQALSFSGEDEGVRCHIQHLFAYCNNNPLPNGETLIDSRFEYVDRGCAKNIEDLGNSKWASDKEYASKLLNLLNQLSQTNNINNQGDGHMKFAIDPGHGCYPDTGAEGYLNEQNCALDVANSVIAKLQTLGNTAWCARPSSASSVTDSLQQRCDSADSADYLVSIHLNASNGEGHGTEVFAMSEAGRELAQRIVDNLASLGWSNRGVKDGSNLYVIHNSNPVAILVEICFVDNSNDANLFNNLGSDVIANAIVKGLTGQTIADSSSQSSSTNSSFSRLLMLQNPLLYGDDVLNYQKQLNQLGYSVDEDGYFGNQCYNATCQVQTKLGLGVDGIVGSQTLAGVAAAILQLTKQTQTVNIPKPIDIPYDNTVPTGENIYQIPNMPGYLEKRNDGGLGIHFDRYNYLTLNKGICELYFNDGNGHKGNKRLDK